MILDTFEEKQHERPGRFGAFVTTLIAFFLVEIGDKTQIATIALGARFHNVIAVAFGTTIGMLIANIPAVLLGQAMIERIPMRAVRTAAALLFLALGLWLLFQTATQ